MVAAHHLDLVVGIDPMPIAAAPRLRPTRSYPDEAASCPLVGRRDAARLPPGRILFVGQAIMVCIKCGATLPPSAATGRPRVYCSVACRRAGEFELRRLQKHLEDLEDSEQHIRLYGGASHAAVLNGPAEAMQRLQAERERLEARLRELLTDETG